MMRMTQFPLSTLVPNLALGKAAGRMARFAQIGDSVHAGYAALHTGRRRPERPGPECTKGAPIGTPFRDWCGPPLWRPR